MNKLKHKHYYDEIYNVHFVFLLNVTSDKQVESILKKNYKNTYKEYKKSELEGWDNSIESCGGKNIQMGGRQIVMVRKMKKYYAPIFYGVLAHECLHAVMDVFKTRGLEYDKKSYNEHSSAHERARRKDLHAYCV